MRALDLHPVANNSWSLYYSFPFLWRVVGWVGLNTQYSNLLNVACSGPVRVEPASCRLWVRYSTTRLTAHCVHMHFSLSLVAILGVCIYHRVPSIRPSRSPHQLRPPSMCMHSCPNIWLQKACMAEDSFLTRVQSAYHSASSRNICM